MVKVFMDIAAKVLVDIAAGFLMDVTAEIGETGELIGTLGFVREQLVHQTLAARWHPLAARLAGQSHGPTLRPLVLGQGRRRQLGVVRRPPRDRLGGRLVTGFVHVADSGLAITLSGTAPTPPSRQ